MLSKKDSQNGTPWALLLGGCLLFAFSYALTFRIHPWADEQFSDLRIYAADAHLMLHGSLPYKDFFFEYPPLSAPLLAIAGIGGTSYEAYRAAFAWLLLPIGISVVPLTWIVARRTNGNELIAVIAIAIAPLMLGTMIRTHFDLVPVALTMAALALLLADRPRLAFAVLGLGIAVKAYPLVVAVIAAAWIWRRAGRRICIEASLTLVGVVGAVVLTSLAVSFHGFLHSVHYQVSRPIEIESTGASILYTLGHLGFAFPHVIQAARSWSLSAPTAGLASGALDLVGVLAVLAIVVLVWRRPDPRRLVLGSLAAIVVFMATGKVLSPQYLIWAIPLFALAAAWSQWLLAVVVGMAMILTFAEFPSHLVDVVHQSTRWLVVLGVRNLLLLAAVLLAIRQLSTAEEVVPAEGRTPARPHPVGAPQPLLDARPEALLGAKAPR